MNGSALMGAALECVAAYYEDQTSALHSVAQMPKNVTSILARENLGCCGAAQRGIFHSVLHKSLKFPLSGAPPNPKTCHVGPC